MASTAEGSVVDAFQNRFGDDLRGVIEYADREEFEVRYLRDDLADRFDEAHTEDIVQELLTESFSKRLQEGSFELGRLTCSVRLFDCAAVVHVLDEEGTGVAASFEPAVIIDGGFVDQCLDATGVDAGRT